MVGFEPQKAAFDALQAARLPHEICFQGAVGAPGEVDLNIYRRSGFTSLYEIDGRTISLIANPHWTRKTRLKKTVRTDCSALDSIADLPRIDLLKIDIRGGELDVFRNARRSLSSAVCVITEVGFFPLYLGAPSFAEVHQERVGQGFLLHKFLSMKSVHLGGADTRSPTAGARRNQLIDGDAVYLRDIRDLGAFAARDLKAMAILGHFVVSSNDPVVRLLTELGNRGEIDRLSAQRYSDGCPSHGVDVAGRPLLTALAP